MKQPAARLINAHEKLFAIDSATADRSYLVSLKHQTCSCPDWTRRRADKPFGSDERNCKHLRAVRAQSTYAIAALKARKLSDQQLVTSIQHYQEAGRHEIAGACRVERHQRAQAAAADQALREVFA